MNSIVKTILLGAACAVPLGLAGCEVGVEPGYSRVEYADEAPPPVVYETYYYDGYYDGPYYRYRNPEGVWIVERREIHDRRVREFHDYASRHPSDSRVRRVQEYHNYNNYHNPNWTQATINRGATSESHVNRGGPSSGRPDQRSNAHESRGNAHESHGNDRDDHR